MYSDVKQVTLIGDVSQLGPCVESETARALGLGRSIMSSYLTTAVYLNQQYRVVRDTVVCLFFVMLQQVGKIKLAI